MLGSCLCGRVGYEVSQLDSEIEHCSCRTCQKAHAAAFNSSATVRWEHFHWSRGQDQLAAYESSPGKLRHFCSNCGSHLIAEITGKPEGILRVATLDEDPGCSPANHIWKSHEVTWLVYGPQIPAEAEW